MDKRVDITDVAYGGSGVGRIDGKVVFVPFTAPGDTVQIEVTLEKKGFSEGRLVEVLSPSEHRTTPICEYFTRCGGCHLQHIQYPEQVRLKQSMLEESLRRIGRLEGVAFDPPLPSSETLGYRSRARFQVKGGHWGFFESGTHRIVDVDVCPVLDPALNDAYAGLKEALAGDKARLGNLYAVDVAVGGRGGQAVAAFYVVDGPKAGGDVARTLMRTLAGVKFLKGFEVRTSRRRDDPAGARLHASVGDTGVGYAAHGLDFIAGIGVFTQVNMGQNRLLIDKVVEYAGSAGSGRVLDLFCGAGNLALSLAKGAKEVTGVEGSREAVEFACENALLNSSKNAEFVRADTAAWLEEKTKTLEPGGFDVVILDPPRGGDVKAARALAKLKLPKIIYVSCSPPTLARDIAVLTGSGYRPVHVGLLDMFPQTFHVECVAGLELTA